MTISGTVHCLDDYGIGSRAETSVTTAEFLCEQDRKNGNSRYRYTGRIMLPGSAVAQGRRQESRLNESRAADQWPKKARNDVV